MVPTAAEEIADTAPTGEAMEEDQPTGDLPPPETAAEPSAVVEPVVASHSTGGLEFTSKQSADVPMGEAEPPAMVEAPVGGPSADETMAVDPPAVQAEEAGVPNGSIDAQPADAEHVRLNVRRRSESPAPPAKRMRTRSPEPASIRGRGSAAAAEVAERVHPPTPSLYISNLARPFTNPALRELLLDAATVGDTEPSELTYFWLDHVKSHCYVTFSSLSAATNARATLNNRVWPESTGRPLAVSHLPSSEIAGLVAEEERAKQMRKPRLELLIQHRRGTDTWTYELLPLSAYVARTSGAGAALDPTGVVGLASSLPMSARGPPPFQINVPASIARAAMILPNTAPPPIPPLGGPAYGAPSAPSYSLHKPSPPDLSRHFRKTEARPALYWCEAADVPRR